MDKLIHHTLYWACDNLTMLLQLIYVDKRARWAHFTKMLQL